MTQEVTKKFLKGLKQYGISYDELKTWKYCGGNLGRHKKYFKLCYPNEDFPEQSFECVCGHHITENCYITDPSGDGLLILGNECIKKFIPNSSRTCEVCGSVHRNRKVNKCNKCKR